MEIVDCLHKDSYTTDSRRGFDQLTSKAVIRRRRVCNTCGKRFSTIEIPVNPGSPTKSVMHRLIGELVEKEYNDLADFLIEIIEGTKHGNR